MATANGIAARIKPASDNKSGICLLVYGRTKTGKTRLFSTFPTPSLLVGCAGYGTEEGTLSIRHVKGVDFVDLQNTEEIEEICDIVVQRDYKSVCLDTAGGYQERVVNEYLNRDPTLRKDWRNVPKTEWGTINDRTICGLHKLFDLGKKRGKHVVVIAHERNFTENSDSELVIPFVGAALTPGVTNWLNASADYIGQTLIRKEVVRKKVETIKGSPPQEIVEATGKKVYCLRVGPSETYQTGFRWEGVGQDLPEFIVNPTYDKITALIRGKVIA